MSEEEIEYTFNQTRVSEVVKIDGVSFLVSYYAVARKCIVCNQTAMRGSSLCADCRTVAEETQQDPEPSTHSPRPVECLRDWISRPCGTVTDRRTQ